MKYGEIWQMVIGNYHKFIDLKTGHTSGLDILSTERKIVIELKNRYNTDNASSRKTNLDKLYKYKIKNDVAKGTYNRFVIVATNIAEAFATRIPALYQDREPRRRRRHPQGRRAAGGRRAGRKISYGR
ncbi:MAG: Eco47II family restriction endonuclease [Proteobacteria bacterium]|nr:Eco47II family restriction endonuclease [Pseudomonadota bacterium]